MKRAAFLHFLIAAVLLLAAPFLEAGQPPPMAGERFPDIQLDAPEVPNHRAYLGLSGPTPFSVRDVDADVLIIEIFNFYCPHCQREAPSINAFYQRVEASPALRGRVKIIGIGVGNSPFEVEQYRKVYQVPFPLFPDGDYGIHKRLGEVRTPYFFGLKPGPGGQGRVFYSKLGGSKDARQILEELVRQSGLSEGGAP